VTVAALYVETGGVYYGLPDVEPWDEQRDARLYAGPWPVVAHPPCGTWSRNLCFVNEARWGKKVGDDGGCFAAALAAVRRFGGVLEHPAMSVAWERFGLPCPVPGGWTADFTDPGVTIEVSQVAYGHAARKRTWLYAVGCELPALNHAEPEAVAMVGANIHTGPTHGKPRIGHRAAIMTPLGFRDVLLDMARSASPALHRLDGCA
jgi:hypothetical protein